MRVARAVGEVREVVGPSVRDEVITRALKDNAYNVSSAINYIVDLTANGSITAFRSEKKGALEVVELLDEDEGRPEVADFDEVVVVASSSKRIKETPPAVEEDHTRGFRVDLKPLARGPSPDSAAQSKAAVPSPVVDHGRWPKTIGKRSVDAESTYRGRPPPELIPGAALVVKRFASGASKNRIIRLATSRGSEIGRLPSALADILAPLIDAQVITCRARVEFLPERFEIFTRFCVTIDFCVAGPSAFNCFVDAETEKNADGEAVKSKRKYFGAEDEDLAERFWKVLQLSFGLLTVDGVYKERLSKGAISLLDDELGATTAPAAQGVEPTEDLSEEQLFGNDADTRLSETPENDDSEVQGGLTVTLRPHQRVAVNWMKKREKGLIKSTSSLSHHPLWSEAKFEDGTLFYINRFTRMATLEPPPNVSHLCKGGILADEMGLGKTIVVLGRITQDINEEQALLSKRAAKDDFYTSSSDEEARGAAEESEATECGTLVIVVTSLLSQWEEEIDAKIAPAQRGMRSAKFSRFSYYGADRDAKTRLSSADIVLTTFGVVAADHKSGNMALFKLKWRRIVLDEAQSVRNGDTLQAKAVLGLDAERRWCLTGTPVQNGIDDLFQLFRFIRLEPWGQRLWWDRVIEKPFKTGNPAAVQRIRSVLADGPVLLRRTHKSIEEEGHAEEKDTHLPKLTTDIVMLRLSEAERAFYDSLYNRSKLEFDGMIATGKASSSYVTILSLLVRLRQASDHPFLVLGRPKADKEEELRRDEEYIKRLSAKYFATTSFSGVASSTSTGASRDFAAKTLKDLATNVAGDCTICLCALTEPVMLKCAHAFCRKCILSLEGNYYGGGQCPICREPFERSHIVDVRMPSRENQISLKDGTGVVSDADELLGARYRSSSKLDKLVSVIAERRVQNKGDDKFLVFSQFTQMLDLCQVAFSKMDPPVKFQRLDGSMSSSKRDNALKSFREKQENEVMLMSLKAGCLGLNITCANVVILLDPWWNAAVEHQAIGRAHRMGQKREVTVMRFIAEDTVEVKMLAVQEKKKAVASDTLGFEQFGADDDEAKVSSKLTLDDLREFFS